MRASAARSARTGAAQSRLATSTPTPNRVVQGDRRRRVPSRAVVVLRAQVKPTAFNLLSLQLGEEEEVLDRALEALETVLPGDTAFLPESVAWTASGSGRAFATLLAEA